MDLGDRLGSLRFLIHNRDQLFTAAFGEVLKAEGLRIITTLPRTPRMNAICERVIGSLRRELLDRTLTLGGKHSGAVRRGWRRRGRPAALASRLGCRRRCRCAARGS